MKIAFVAHEFGIFPSHGGIASYLLQVVDCLLSQSTVHEVDVICLVHGPVDDLLAKYPDRFRLHAIGVGKSTYQVMVRTKELLKAAQPDTVEVADYLGLAKLAMLEKRLGFDFLNTVFVTNHHSATQEIYEWCNEITSSLASPGVKRDIMNERDQMRLADANIAPSQFLAAYDVNRYRLPKPMQVFPYPYTAKLRTQATVRAEATLFDPDADNRKFTVTIVSRFEPRKNQVRLVREFTSFLRQLEDQGEPIEGIELHLAGNTVTMEIGGQDYRQHVCRTVDSRYRSHIHFWDFLKLDQQDHLTSIADVAVMPSTFENFPVAMIETVLRGIPVMGSKHSGVADYSVADAELLTFDPFHDGDLSENLLTFYRTSLADRQAIQSRQEAELRALLDPALSVHGRMNYYESLQRLPPEQALAARSLPTLFLAPPSEANAIGNGGLNSFSRCGDLLAELRSRDPDFTHASLCLLSDDQVSPRLLHVTEKGRLDFFSEAAVVFTNDEFFGEVFEAVLGGYAILLPHISRGRLESCARSESIFEFLIAEAMKRTVLVDNSAEVGPRPAIKAYTDHCFVRKNYVIDQLAKEVAACPSKSCSSTVVFKKIAMEKSSPASAGGAPSNRMRSTKSWSAPMPTR